MYLQGQHASGAMTFKPTERSEAQAARAAQRGCPPGLPHMVAQLPCILQAAAAQQPEQARHQPLLGLGIPA